MQRKKRYAVAYGDSRLESRLILLAMAHHVPVTVDDRRNRLEEIRRLLLAIIPRERGKTMK